MHSQRDSTSRCWDWKLALQIVRFGYGQWRSELLWHTQEFQVCVHWRQQDFLPDEPRRGLYSWRRISLHNLWLHCTDFPRRTTPWRGRRPHQHVLRAIRALGRAEQDSAEIQKDWADRPCLHLLDIWIYLQVLPTCISRRTHFDSTNDSFQLIWCSMVLWLEGWRILPSHDHKRVWADRTFCAGSKEDRDNRTIRQAHWECSSGRIFSGPEWTPQARRHQDEPHQLFEQTFPWT